MTNNKIYNKFSEEYDELFIKNIIQFQEKNKTSKDEDSKRNYAVFYPSFGMRKEEPCDFLIYGQAVNGWNSEFNMNDSKLKIQKDRLQNALKFSNEFYSEENHNPLDWVNVYWSKGYYNKFAKSITAKNFYEEMSYQAFRSFFWNVAYKLICKYYPLNFETLDWTKKMVWSNLYKITGQNRNPYYKEQLFQRDISTELVKKEIEELKPKYCIVLTNEDWWKPFREKLKTTQLENSIGSPILSVEMYLNTKIVLTTRPYRGSSDKHVSQILKLIGKNC